MDTFGFGWPRGFGIRRLLKAVKVLWTNRTQAKAVQTLMGGMHLWPQPLRS
jgi:hypothetical protein